MTYLDSNGKVDCRNHRHMPRVVVTGEVTQDANPATGGHVLQHSAMENSADAIEENVYALRRSDL